jgi:hypothetical protein
MKAMEKMVENTTVKVGDDMAYAFRTKKENFLFSAKFLLDWCGVDILCHYDEERLKELTWPLVHAIYHSRIAGAARCGCFFRGYIIN